MIEFVFYEAYHKLLLNTKTLCMKATTTNLIKYM